MGDKFLLFVLFNREREREREGERVYVGESDDNEIRTIANTSTHIHSVT